MAKSPEILDTFDLQLLSPVEFVSRLDSIEREREYHPSRLGASSILTKRLEPHEINRFIESFRRHPHEKISVFKSLTDTCLLDPKTTSLHVAHDSSGEMAASIAINRQSPQRIHIPLLRINSLPLAKTVLRHLLMKAIVDAVESDAHSFHIGEPHLTHEITDALVEMGFGQTAGGWVKPVVRGFHFPHRHRPTRHPHLARQTRRRGNHRLPHSHPSPVGGTLLRYRVRRPTLPQPLGYQ